MARKSKYIDPSFELEEADVFRILSSRTNLSSEHIRAFMDLWRKRNPFLNKYAEKTNSSVETTRNQFMFLNAALVYGVDLIVSGIVSKDDAELAIKDVNKAQEVAARLRAETPKQDLEARVTSVKDPIREREEAALTKVEILEILDRQIREHDRNGGKAADLATLLDKRARLEGMYTAEQKKEIDVEQTLGRAGLAGIDDTIAQRLALLMRHYPKSCPAFAIEAKRLLSGVEEAPAPASTLPDAGEAIPTEPPPPISEALE